MCRFSWIYKAPAIWFNSALRLNLIILMYYCQLITNLFMSNNNQRKGMILAFAGIMFITPDSLLIRLANLESWNLIFYRGFIPFSLVLLGLLIIYKEKLFKEIINNGWHGFFYACTFTLTNIVFVVSIERTTAANTLIMVALAPMLSAIISFFFLKEKILHQIFLMEK